MKMGSPTKVFTILFFTAFAIFTNAQIVEQKRSQISDPISVAVPFTANVAAPIQLEAQDYSGPYDPADPKGIGAANRRNAKLQGQKRVEIVKSYIPPGTETFAKKQLTHLVTSEGRRFAFAHPKEASEIVGIAMKMKNLVHDAAKKIQKAEEKNHDRH